MSFIHYTLVGHFDPRAYGPNRLACSRPIDPERVARMLAEYPEELAKWVTFQDGYVRCQWAPVPPRLSHDVYEIAYRLAREEGCLAVENGREVTYPPEAVRVQFERWEQESGRVGIAAAKEEQARRHAEERERRYRRR